MAHHQHYRSPFGDTTLTKVFVGGLAWETPTDLMRSYFEQFGEILEAVIITDKHTGKSKGYGFVSCYYFFFFGFLFCNITCVPLLQFSDFDRFVTKLILHYYYYFS